MNQTQSQRSLANVCLFCNEDLQSPSMCKFCGFKFCDEHLAADSHQCIKTRYFEHIKKTNNSPNVANGKFRVVCEICGYVSKKGAPIEYAGEELEQHTQMIGCSQNIFLEEVSDEEESTKKVKVLPKESTSPTPTPVTAEDQKSSDDSNETSIVEQILKLSSFKEKGMISEDEFEFIKKELIKKLK